MEAKGCAVNYTHCWAVEPKGCAVNYTQCWAVEAKGCAVNYTHCWAVEAKGCAVNYTHCWAVEAKDCAVKYTHCWAVEAKGCAVNYTHRWAVEPKGCAVNYTHTAGSERVNERTPPAEMNRSPSSLPCRRLPRTRYLLLALVAVTALMVTRHFVTVTPCIRSHPVAATPLSSPGSRDADQNHSLTQGGRVHHQSGNIFVQRIVSAPRFVEPPRSKRTGPSRVRHAMESTRQEQSNNNNTHVFTCWYRRPFRLIYRFQIKEKN